VHGRLIFFDGAMRVAALLKNEKLQQAHLLSHFGLAGQAQ